MSWRAGLIIACLSMPASVLAGSAAIIDAIYADDLSGNVLIRYRDGTIVTAPKDRNQRSLSRPALAEDQQTAGWLGDYDSCCQSYPIPRQLVIWRSGRSIRRIDAGAMIWNWRFYKRGKEVGVSDGPTHGSNTPYSYKLYDLPTGRLISEIDGRAANFPEWARALVPQPAR